MESSESSPGPAESLESSPVQPPASAQSSRLLKNVPPMVLPECSPVPAERPAKQPPASSQPAELLKDRPQGHFENVLEAALSRRDDVLMKQIEHQHKQLLQAFENLAQKSWQPRQSESMGIPSELHPVIPTSPALANSEQSLPEVESTKPTGSLDEASPKWRPIDQVLEEMRCNDSLHGSQGVQSDSGGSGISRDTGASFRQIYLRGKSSAAMLPSEVDEEEQYCKAKEVSSKREKVPEEDEVKLPPWKLAMQRLAESDGFQALLAGVVFGNCALMGVQLELSSEGLLDSGLDAFFWLEALCAVVFAIETVVKLLAYGKDFFLGPARFWNLADLFIVIFSILDLCLQLNSNGNFESASQLRLARVLFRIARVMKLMKLVKALRTLRTLIHSILGTLKSFLWSLSLVSLLIYMFGMIFTEAVLFHLASLPSSGPADGSEPLNQYFGSLLKSMTSLFASISGGLDWNLAAGALNEIHPFWSMLFMAYIAFSCFALLNIMTGVFCQSAIESAQRDRDMAVQNVMQNRQRFEEILRSIFHQLDDDHDGVITLTEFEYHFQDEAFKGLLHSLELEVEDAWTLFMMLDMDGSHDIDAAEFLDGCMHLKGPFKAIEGARFKRQTEQKLALMHQGLVEIQAQQLESTLALRDILAQVGERPIEFRRIAT